MCVCVPLSWLLLAPLTVCHKKRRKVCFNRFVLKQEATTENIPQDRRKRRGCGSSCGGRPPPHHMFFGNIVVLSGLYRHTPLWSTSTSAHGNVSVSLTWVNEAKPRGYSQSALTSHGTLFFVYSMHCFDCSSALLSRGIFTMGVSHSQLTRKQFSRWI